MSTEAQPIRIAIADDHPLLRVGIQQVIAQNPEMQVVAESANGQDALAAIERFSPDAAILDIDMPKLDGLGVAREVRERGLNVHLVFLTVHEGEDLFHEAMDLGAKAYLLKDSALTEIVEAIRTVCAGKYYVTPAMTSHLLRRLTRLHELAKQKPRLAELTPIERRILQLVAANRATKDIAAELGMQARTVENRRTAICDKLDLHGPNALLRFALDHRAQIG